MNKLSTFTFAGENDCFPITKTTTFGTSSGHGIVNPIFIDDLHQNTQSTRNSNFEVLPKPLVTFGQLPGPSRSKSKKQQSLVETIDRTDSASTVSSAASTVLTNASSTGDLLPFMNEDLKLKSRPCPDCIRFHENEHRAPTGQSILVPPSAAYAPYPPQWYYLLAADTNKFRKHRHTHYRRDCRQCRSIVRSTFEQYYLGESKMNNQLEARFTPETLTDSVGSISLDNRLATLKQSNHLTAAFLKPRRSSCGHSCLKLTILFYCSVAVIMSICFICYLTKMFGFLTNSSNVISSANANLTGSDNFDEINSSMTDQHEKGENMSTENTFVEMIGTETIGLLISSSFLIIFMLGLIGAFLESRLFLRIFGAILSYLFLLTFGSALYIIILFVISHVPLKLILSTISCSAVAITIHALIAIAPFAFADLIGEENQQDQIDSQAINSTYFKYPSIRPFIPIGPPLIKHPYYLDVDSQPINTYLTNNTLDNGTITVNTNAISQQDNDSVILSSNINVNGTLDNSSCQELIPMHATETADSTNKSSTSNNQTVRFT